MSSFNKTSDIVYCNLNIQISLLNVCKVMSSLSKSSGILEGKIHHQTSGFFLRFHLVGGFFQKFAPPPPAPPTYSPRAWGVGGSTCSVCMVEVGLLVSNLFLAHLEQESRNYFNKKLF